MNALPAAAWCEAEGIEVIDPDGWREDGLPWETPITRDEFMRRVFLSTIRMPRVA